MTSSTSSRARGAASVAFGTGLLVLCTATLIASCGGGGGGEPVTPGSAQFTVIDAPASFVSTQTPLLSLDGSVAAATAVDAQGRTRAFRWSAAAGATLLPLMPDGTRSTAAGISSDGSVVVGSGDTSAAPATASVVFRWDAAAGTRMIAPLPNASICSAGGVSGDGQTLAGTCLVANNMGFRYSDALGLQPLGQYGGGLGAASTATSISRDGAVIGGAGNPHVTGAMVWDASNQPTVIGRLNPDDASATVTAVLHDARTNPQGTAQGTPATLAFGVTQDAANQLWMFRWSEATGMQRLTAAPGGLGGTVPAAASGDGRRVVGWSLQAGSEGAVMWDEAHGLRALADALASGYGLALPGWTLLRATSISDDGRSIAGTGIGPQGQARAWIVHLSD